jgi:hypothetical protein
MEEKSKKVTQSGTKRILVNLLAFVWLGLSSIQEHPDKIAVTEHQTEYIAGGLAIINIILNFIGKRKDI